MTLTIYDTDQTIEVLYIESIEIYQKNGKSKIITKDKKYISSNFVVLDNYSILLFDSEENHLRLSYFCFSSIK